MFSDRIDAGEQLADELHGREIGADLVLAIPRGALPLGRPVADRLDADLDVVVAKKIGAPDNPELAIGAVAENGSVWLNDDIIERLGVPESYVEAERERERDAARAKADRYRSGPPPTIANQRIVVVDDGVATGATMRACLQNVLDDDPAAVVVAVPVGPPETLSAFEEIADEVVVLETPASFRAVGAYYRDFHQVSDEEARGYLEY